MTLEQRLARAERNQRRLVGALVLTLIGGIGLAAAPNDNDTWTGQKIVLKHPNGGPAITLSASESSSGIWIGDPNKQGGKYDVALVDSTTGPQLLMASKDGKLAGIAPTEGANAGQNGTNLFRFYTASSQPVNPGR